MCKALDFIKLKLFWLQVKSNVHYGESGHSYFVFSTYLVMLGMFVVLGANMLQYMLLKVEC